MASSGSFSGSIASGKYKLRVDWSATQNVAANTSKVTCVLYLVQASSWSLNIASRTDNTANVAGTSRTWTSPAISNSGGKTTKLATVTSGTITHNADGTKSVTLSATFNIKATISGTYYSVITASQTVTLNTIPRATQPTVSASSVNMGSSVTINTPRASSAFTHDLAYAFAGSGYTTIATGVGTSHSWTVPDLASKIPSSTSGTVTIRCITKSGSTTVGTKTVLLTAKVPTSVVPTISGVATVETTSGLAAQFGAFIQNKSKIKATITASGAKGSTITKYSTTFNGKTYTGSTWTSSTVTGSGSLSLVTTVTDSRGRTAKRTTTINVLAYTQPRVTEFTAFRADDTGAMNAEGTRASISFAYSVASLGGKNTASMTVTYKRTTETTWSESILNGTGLSNSGLVLASPTFSVDYQYDIRMQVRDWFGATSTYTTVLPSGAVIMDFKADGKGVAFFKTAERAGVEIGSQTWFSNGEVPKDAKVLAGTADLNTVLTPGFYVFSGTNSQTIANMPISGTASGSVQVIREGESTQVRQVVTRCSASSREVWERLYYSSAWQDWVCVYNGGDRILWRGSYYMSAGQTANLAEKVSEQRNGIVLVFSRYSSGTEQNYHFNHFFVHKAFVAAHPGVGNQFFMTTDGSLSVVATKYIYINDDSLTGNDNNNKSGEGSGITYNNAGFVLRYVIGV